ncbi:MAG TPA: hypothetical protein VFV90_08445, partial [Usitatibacter sp.]|nr:hypothetical protein [Usitatibacter sp.]
VAVLLALLLAFGAAASPSASGEGWPPPAPVAARMRELQAEISSKDATPEQRESARRELGKLLKSPGAPAPAAKSPPRAAIQPFPSIASPTLPLPPAPRVDPDDVAKLEVVGPPRAIVNPSTGAPVMPLGSTVVDTRTGRILTETPSGYMDPVTGTLIPK